MGMLHELLPSKDKRVRYRTSGNKNQVTLIPCVTASGQRILPFVIFDAKRLNMECRKDEVVGTVYQRLG